MRADKGAGSNEESKSAPMMAKHLSRWEYSKQANICAAKKAITKYTPRSFIGCVSPSITSSQSIGGGGSSQSTQTGPNGDYWTITAGNYNVEVRAVTQCGHIVGSNTIYAAGSYSSSASPNPANNTLNVNIEELENEGVNALPAASRQTSAYYDIRLYNLQGTLLRSLRVASGQTSIDVSGLPGGNYFLHVYKDGTAEPQVHKIIISH